ncbi:MAG: glycoside hydrolase family 127 protein, partial [Prevotella salivae]|nr:glycoside hydrolase family 127 protein [Segatella salivae]
RKGDVITLQLDMKPHMVMADNKVKDDRGCIAVERGPLVYCAESADNFGANTNQIYVNKKASFKLTKDYSIKNTEADGTIFKVDALQTEAQLLTDNSEGNLQLRDMKLTLIPYYAWNHRGTSCMNVWLKTTELK